MRKRKDDFKYTIIAKDIYFTGADVQKNKEEEKKRKRGMEILIRFRRSEKIYHSTARQVTIDIERRERACCSKGSRRIA